MKSNREFIDGIYAKAELKKKETPKKFHYRKAAIVPMAAAVAAIFILSDIAGAPVILKDSDEGINQVQQQEDLEKSRLRVAPGEYYLEGYVVTILKPYMGYERIEVKVNGDKSDLQGADTVIVAYEEESNAYQVGDYVKATLTEKTIGTQEYLVIAK